MKKQLRVHYDEEGDFLEIAAGTPTKCYAEEIQPGIFVRIDEKTKKVIEEFRKQFKVDNRKIADQKILDFLIWSLGRLGL